jgi:hypothetical protein
MKTKLDWGLGRKQGRSINSEGGSRDTSLTAAVFTVRGVILGRDGVLVRAPKDYKRANRHFGKNCTFPKEAARGAVGSDQADFKAQSLHG